MSHLEYLKRRYSENHISLAAHMPYGGVRSRKFEGKNIYKRKYDVVFCATNYGTPERQWQALNNGLSKIMDEVADVLISAKSISIWDAFQYVLKTNGMEDDKIVKMLLPYFGIMYFYLRTYRRLKCMETVANSGIKVDVFGNGWESVPFAKKIKIHGAVDYNSSIDIYAQSKILLNEGATFDDGVHDRIFSGMLNGTAVVSDYSSYFEKCFTAETDLLTYGWDNVNEMPNKIDKLLSNDMLRLTMVNSAYKKVINRHTWASRGQYILDIVSMYRVANGL